MASTIAFPSTESRSHLSKSDTSLVSRHTTAIDVCNLVYGHTDPVSWDTLGRFYEADAVYENPIITATSRNSIGDVHSLTQYLSELDAPNPTSLLRSLLGLARIPADRESWFQISRMWTEVDDVCENESFGESALTPFRCLTLDSQTDACQMGIGDALWSIRSIYSSFPGFTPNAIWAT